MPPNSGGREGLIPAEVQRREEVSNKLALRRPELGGGGAPPFMTHRLCRMPKPGLCGGHLRPP